MTSKKLLVSAAEAIERIMLALKDITELTGYTQRVADMIQVFEEVAQDKYQKTTIKQDSDSLVTSTSNKKSINMSVPEGMI